MGLESEQNQNEIGMESEWNLDGIETECLRSRDRTGTDKERNVRQRRGNGKGTEQIRKRNGTDMKQKCNGNKMHLCVRGAATAVSHNSQIKFIKLLN